MSRHSKNQRVVKQAAFLMAAHIVSSIIGLLYRSPLQSIMGDVGAGYYSFAYEWYMIILLISSYSIPSAVSKVMAERLAVKEYRNASRVFRAALFYVLGIGGIGAAFAYFGAPWLLRDTPDAVLALRILAPTIWLSGFLGVFRGFFQAHNTMRPTAVSQVIEQVINAVFSVLMAWLFIRPHLSSSNLRGKYGAAGGTFGTFAGVLTGLLFMLLVFFYNRRTIQRRIHADRHRDTEPYIDVFRDILLMVTPIILATCVYNVTTIIDQRMFTRLMIGHGLSAEQVSSQYGLFGYRFKTINNIPVSLASATSTALIPAVATSLAEKNRKDALEKIENCIRLTLFVSIPSAIGLLVLAYPVNRLLYPTGNVEGAARLLMFGALSVITYSLSTVMNGVLQSTGHPMIPVRNALIAIAVNVLTLYLCCGPFGMGVGGIMITHIVYGLVVCILNIVSIRKRLRYRSNIRSTYLVPAGSALIMGAAVAFCYHVPAKLLPSFFGRYMGSALLTAFSILVGILVYIIAFSRLSGKTDDEIRELPMGTKMLQLLRILHVR